MFIKKTYLSSTGFYWLFQKQYSVEDDIKNDILIYFILKNNEKVFYDTALINDYKTNILMNKLFRNIKENDCLMQSKKVTQKNRI